MAEPEHSQLNIWQEPGDTETRTAVALESAFHFHCHSGLDCFNRCCREATLILSPYDILRLSRRLGMATGEFLKRYTRREEEAGSGLPLVLARPAAPRRLPLPGGGRLHGVYGSPRGLPPFPPGPGE